MDQLRHQLKINAKAYDHGTAAIREELGSYESIAAACYAHTSKTISGNAIRRWFLERSIPVEYAAVFQELTFGTVDITDFYPWLPEFLGSF